MSGDDYRRARAQAAWALESLNKIIPSETIDGLDWRWLAEQVERSPENFLAAAVGVRAARARPKRRFFADFYRRLNAGEIFPRVVDMDAD